MSMMASRLSRISLPTLLIPGVACTARLWAPVLEHDNADSSGDWDAATSLRNVSDFVVPEKEIQEHSSIHDMAAAILETAPDEFNLAGLSMGGYVAMELCRQAPERVSRLALMSTQARGDSEEVKKRRVSLIKVAEKKGMRAVIEMQAPMLLSEGVREHCPDIVESVIQMAEESGVQAFVNQQTACMTRKDSRASLRHLPAHLEQSLLIVCGRADSVTPVASHREMVKYLPGAAGVLCILDDCGHLCSVEEPKSVREMMRVWLNTHDLSEEELPWSEFEKTGRRHGSAFGEDAW